MEEKACPEIPRVSVALERTARVFGTDLKTFSTRVSWTTFSFSKSCSELVLNLSRKDRVCPSGMLKQRVAGMPSVSPLNLAPVTSNKTLHIVYSNLWSRKSGFTCFSFFPRGSKFNLPIFLLSLSHF